jgi:hypothetical protein
MIPNLIRLSLITFGFQSLAPGNSFHFSYDRQQKTCTLIIDSKLSETFPIDINNEDKLGVLYISETNAIGMTWNGTVKGKF